MIKNYVFFIFSLFAILLPLPVLALTQNVKQWMALNLQQNYGKDNPWHTFLYSQLRFIDQNNPWQAILVEGGLGYQFATERSIWVGYRWTGRNPYHGFYQANRMFQQYIFQKPYSVLYRFINRTRLEEITHSNDQQIGLRLRQRFAVERNKAVFKDIFPFVYDEVFFQLNHPNYMPHTFIGENRLFLGFNLYCSRKTWWEIGYINQYRVRSPQQTQNEMSHILSFTYNYV